MLVRCRINRLTYIDRVTGEPLRRYEHPYPGSMIHVDVTKFGNIPDGGGHRFVGRQQGSSHARETAHRTGERGANSHPRIGTAYVHTVIDDHSRVAYAEICADEKAVTAIGVLRRATAWFAGSSGVSAVHNAKKASEWNVVPTGDGAYTIQDAASGKVLAVDSSSDKGRAWGAAPTLREKGDTSGEQWFVIEDTDPKTGKKTGTSHLVNRYSGLVLSVAPGGKVTTTPTRSWAGKTLHSKRETSAQQQFVLSRGGKTKH